MTGRANHAGQVSVPNVILRFSYIRHRSLSHDFFLLTFSRQISKAGSGNHNRTTGTAPRRFFQIM